MEYILESVPFFIYLFIFFFLSVQRRFIKVCLRTRDMSRDTKARERS